MRINKNIILSAAIATSVVNIAGAAGDVFITGSTAARNSTVQAIAADGVIFDGVPATTKVFQGTQTAANYFKDSLQNITGHLPTDGAGVLTTIHCHWSGSEAGIGDLVGSPATETFLDNSATSTTDGSNNHLDLSSAVDLAMADNNKTYSKQPGAAITGTVVGVIPFKFLLEKGSGASLTGSITDVTDPMFRQVATGGARAALFTGNTADQTYVYLTGRDSFSGTRVNTLGDTKYGIGSSVFQLEVNSDGSMKDSDGTQSYVGSSDSFGYNSGGSVATQMGVDLSQSTSLDLVNGTGFNHYSVIAYLGFSDAATALGTAGVTELSYNGVTESTLAVEDGTYSLWGIEYIYKKNAGESAAALAAFNGLSAATGISGHDDNTSLIALSKMHCVVTGNSARSPLTDPVHN